MSEKLIKLLEEAITKNDLLFYRKTSIKVKEAMEKTLYLKTLKGNTTETKRYKIALQMVKVQLPFKWKHYQILTDNTRLFYLEKQVNNLPEALLGFRRPTDESIERLFPFAYEGVSRKIKEEEIKRLIATAKVAPKAKVFADYIEGQNLFIFNDQGYPLKYVAEALQILGGKEVEIKTATNHNLCFSNSYGIGVLAPLCFTKAERETFNLK